MFVLGEKWGLIVIFMRNIEGEERKATTSGKREEARKLENYKPTTGEKGEYQFLFSLSLARSSRGRNAPSVVSGGL